MYSSARTKAVYSKRRLILFLRLLGIVAILQRVKGRMQD